MVSTFQILCASEKYEKLHEFAQVTFKIRTETAKGSRFQPSRNKFTRSHAQSTSRWSFPLSYLQCAPILL